MLKLYFYKKSKKRLCSYNTRRFTTNSFVLLSVQKNLLFNNMFDVVKRMCILFFFSYYSIRERLFCISHLKNQCLLSWRSGSVYNFFKLTRLEIRERSHFGFLKGVRKSSW